MQMAIELSVYGQVNNEMRADDRVGTYPNFSQERRPSHTGTDPCVDVRHVDELTEEKESQGHQKCEREGKEKHRRVEKE